MISRTQKKVIRYLERIGVDYQLDTKQNGLSFDVHTPEGEWKCTIIIASRKDARIGVAVYSTLPTIVPERKRYDVALFLMCLNNDRVFGNFELDPDTGNLHFKTYLEFQYKRFSEKDVEQNMLYNISIMQQHIPQLTQMITLEMVYRA